MLVKKHYIVWTQDAGFGHSQDGQTRLQSQTDRPELSLSGNCGRASTCETWFRDMKEGGSESDCSLERAKKSAQPELSMQACSLNYGWDRLGRGV